MRGTTFVIIFLSVLLIEVSIMYYSLRGDYVQLAGNYSELYNAYLNLTDKYSALENDYGELTNEYQQYKSECAKNISALERGIDMLRADLLEYQKAELIRSSVSFKEVLEFIHEDKTNLHAYDETNFNCVDYADMLIRNAMQEGIFMCSVYLLFNDGAHSIVAVNTTDKGIVYIEPQDDSVIFDLKVGDNYCKKVGWSCTWIIKDIKTCFHHNG